MLAAPAATASLPADEAAMHPGPPLHPCAHGLMQISPDGRWHLCPAPDGTGCEPVPILGLHGGQVVPSPGAPNSQPPRSVPRSEWEWEILNCPNIDKLAKLVGITLSRFADFETGRGARPSQAKIAAILGYNKTDSVGRILKSLRDDGWIYREGKGPAPEGGGRPTDLYRLTVPRHDHKHDGSALPWVD